MRRWETRPHLGWGHPKLEHGRRPQCPHTLGCIARVPALPNWRVAPLGDLWRHHRARLSALQCPNCCGDYVRYLTGADRRFAAQSP